MTREEMLAAYHGDANEALAHFNPFHNPKNGQFAKKNGGGSSLSPRGKQIAKRAAIVGGALAGVSALATVGNAIGAQQGLDLMGYGDKLSKSAVVRAGAKKAGQVAIAGALATIGGHMAKDYMTQGETKKKKPDAK
ncbi:MAG: hypothetical protein J6U54_09875 [Clostridiales bacterium]|nr:hypothetical protein [Clostridiales bacterium]